MRLIWILLPAVLCRAASLGPSPSDIDHLYPGIEALYIDIHSNPELAFQEKQTAAKLAARVKELGYEVTTGVGGTGVVALLKNGSGPIVMLRTELDALPVTEQTGLPFSSKIPGVMHACGHDLHMAAWAGTAQWMAAHRADWHGTLMLIGQPAEEAGSGASAMLKDGLFVRFPKPDFAIALHDDDTLPAGVIGYHAGFFRAAADFPTVTIFGRGGHGAMPQNTVDPIVIAASTILAWQTIVSRENDPQSPVVITVGAIHGGTKNNIIPDQVQLLLSVRTFDPLVRKRVLAAIARIAKGEAEAAGAPREPLIEPTTGMTGDAAVYNDPELTNRLAATLKKGMPPGNVVEMPAKMTSEDFSDYGRAGVKAALLHIGAVDPEKLAESRRTGVPVPAPHSPQWAPVRETTIKAAVQAETLALLNLLN
ncbi:MAG TPA: amidohydrolase [Bryobacteraceae bacterium]|nr:amidohydrolase [Bryobacteraceae bacterium]